MYVWIILFFIFLFFYYLITITGKKISEVSNKNKKRKQRAAEAEVKEKEEIKKLKGLVDDYYISKAIVFCMDNELNTAQYANRLANIQITENAFLNRQNLPLFSEPYKPEMLREYVQVRLPAFLSSHLEKNGFESSKGNYLSKLTVGPENFRKYENMIRTSIYKQSTLKAHKLI